MQEHPAATAGCRLHGRSIHRHHQRGRRRPQPGQIQQDPEIEPGEAGDCQELQHRRAGQVLLPNNEVHQIVWKKINLFLLSLNKLFVINIMVDYTLLLPKN